MTAYVAAISLIVIPAIILITATRLAVNHDKRVAEIEQRQRLIDTLVVRQRELEHRLIASTPVVRANTLRWPSWMHEPPPQVWTAQEREVLGIDDTDALIERLNIELGA